MSNNPDPTPAHTRSSGSLPVVRFAVKGIIALAIIGYLLHGMDTDNVGRQILGIDPLHLFMAMVLGCLISFVASVRWYYVIRATGHRLTWYRVLQLTLTGTFFNQVLPTSMGGDLARIPYAHQSGLPLGSSVSSVILDRAAGMTALVVLVLATLPLDLSILDASHARWTLAGVAACGLAGIALVLCMALVPARLIPRVLEPLINLSLSLRETLAGRYAPAVLVPGVAVHVVRVATVYAIATGMHLDINFTDCLVLVPPALLLTLLPVSIGGWGIREGAFVVAFGFTGLPPEQAFALSVLFGVTILVAGLLGAPFWIFLRKQGSHPGENT